MRKFKILFVFILVSFLCAAQLFAQESKDSTFLVINLSEDEIHLYELINEYRTQKGLEIILLSPSLCYVAQQHAIDLSEHEPNAKKRCNLHSWSDNGPWSACCYTSNHKKASCVWDKPRELTNYKGDGYEVAYWTSKPGAVAEDALVGWKKSKGHNQTIINRNSWKSLKWNAIGIGIKDGYALVWFGTEKDPAGSLDVD